MSKIKKIYIGVLESEVVKRRSGFVIRCIKKRRRRVDTNRSLVVLQCETDSLGGVSCWSGFDWAEVVSSH